MLIFSDELENQSNLNRLRPELLDEDMMEAPSIASSEPPVIDRFIPPNMRLNDLLLRLKSLDTRSLPPELGNVITYDQYLDLLLASIGYIENVIYAGWIAPNQSSYRIFKDQNPKVARTCAIVLLNDEYQLIIEPNRKNKVGKKNDNLIVGKGTFKKVKKGYRLDKPNVKPIAVVKMSETYDKLMTYVDRETRFLQRLNHPNIMKLKQGEIYYNKKSQYTAVFYSKLATTDLYKMSINGEFLRLPFVEKLEIYRGILHGLNYMHHQGIKHNDIKLENILMVNKVPKIIDFGFSAQTSKLFGTYGYEAPEVHAFYAVNPKQASPIFISNQAKITTLGNDSYQRLSQFERTTLYDSVIKSRKPIASPEITRAFDAHNDRWAAGMVGWSMFKGDRLPMAVLGLLKTMPLERISVQQALHSLEHHIEKLKAETMESTHLIKMTPPQPMPSLLNTVHLRPVKEQPSKRQKI